MCFYPNCYIYLLINKIMRKILMQKILLLTASLATGLLLYKIFGEKIGNGLVERVHTGNQKF